MSDQLPADITAAIEALEDAAQEHGWEAAGGTSERVRSASADRQGARAALEAAILKLADENGRLRKGIQDMLDGNYPHPRSYRPGKCAHDVWYFDECPSCDEAHLQAILNLGGGFNEQATANSDAGHGNER